MKFYTYLYLRLGGTPYYVGKGKGYRAYTQQGHHVPIPKDKARILIQYFPNEASALIAEIFLIEYYGRKDIGTGILRNRTNGGDGHANPSEETRRKLSDSAKGNTRALGVDKSLETRMKLSRALKGRKFTPEWRAKISAAAKKRRMSKETREKMSASHKGNKSCLGYKHTPETRLKMSLSRKGKPKPPRTPEHSAKIWASRRAKCI
jgi:hypothetical protein